MNGNLMLSVGTTVICCQWPLTSNEGTHIIEGTVGTITEVSVLQYTVDFGEAGTASCVGRGRIRCLVPEEDPLGKNLAETTQTEDDIPQELLLEFAPDTPIMFTEPSANPGAFMRIAPRIPAGTLVGEVIADDGDYYDVDFGAFGVAESIGHRRIAVRYAERHTTDDEPY